MTFRKPLLAVGLLLCSAAHAGTYTDSLSACLVGKSTMDDHVVIVQWMFAAMSEKPARCLYSGENSTEGAVA
jgi:hypothetical protein